MRVMAVLKKQNYSINPNAAALGRLSRATWRKRGHYGPSQESARQKTALVDVLKGIRSGTEAIERLMREFARLQQSVESLARSTGLE